MPFLHIVEPAETSPDHPQDGRLAMAAPLVDGGAFLDEPAGYNSPGRPPESQAAFDLFPDEDDTAAASVPAVAWMKASGSANETVTLAPVAAAGKAGTLAKTRPSIVAVFLVVAATAALASVRACENGDVSQVAVWRLPPR